MFRSKLKWTTIAGEFFNYLKSTGITQRIEANEHIGSSKSRNIQFNMMQTETEREKIEMEEQKTL